MTRRARPFPKFLSTIFDADAFVRAESTVVVIDPNGTILWVNPAWDRFARENGGDGALVRSSSYFDGISRPLREYYRSAFDNALATGEAFEQQYECSSPSQQRMFHLRAMPIADDGLVLEHSLVMTRAHDPGHDTHADDEAAHRRADGIIVQCSNCRRVRRPNVAVWDWVPALVARRVPNVSHGICASCAAFYFGEWRTGR